MATIDLSGEWEFRAVEGSRVRNLPSINTWLPATVPGTVHTDLMANGIIPDPFFRMNELDVQWVEEVTWLYRKVFQVPETLLREKRIWLEADGLDTYATIRLNGQGIGESANMFIGHTFDLRGILREGDNTIEIELASPVRRSKQIEQEQGRLRVALESHRAYVRKAQYSFGWDWGPKLTTSGIWKGVTVRAESQAILRDPFVRVTSMNRSEAVVAVSVDIEGILRRGTRVVFQIEKDGKAWSTSVPARKAGAKSAIRISQPQLWWPNGHGDQPLYNLSIALVHKGVEIHALANRFGLRTVRLLQEKDAEGKSFILLVNGKKIFCKGADWIPADNFLPRISPSRYENLLGLARDAHMNMIRVWGGGIYESDLFYELCDRLGLMVWQDFMFACGEYPDHGAFLREVQEESEKVIKRLRNHPSLALWCGNNECEWLFCMENPGKGPDAMRGATIFRDVLPKACRQHDGTRPYWRSSPFGDGFPNDESNGNHHQWTVWSAWRDFRGYERDNARFVTEFGFQALPHVRTMASSADAGELRPQSQVVEHHNKQVEGPERLIRFIAGHYTVDMNFARFTYLSQLVQAEALKCAVEHWRRRQYRTAGTLFWQLNDCWPVASWAVIDSALRPKASYYYAKRFFAPLLLSLTTAGKEVHVWATNDGPGSIKGLLSVSRRAFDGTSIWKHEVPVTVSPDSSRVIFRIKREELDSIRSSEEYVVATISVDNAVVAENRHFFSEAKHQRLPDPGLKWEVSGEPGKPRALSLSASALARNVEITIEGHDVTFDDNFIDIDAGGTKVVRFRSVIPTNEIRAQTKLQWLR